MEWFEARDDVLPSVDELRTALERMLALMMRQQQQQQQQQQPASVRTLIREMARRETVGLLPASRTWTLSRKRYLKGGTLHINMVIHIAAYLARVRREPPVQRYTVPRALALLLRDTALVSGNYAQLAQRARDTHDVNTQAVVVVYAYISLTWAIPYEDTRARAVSLVADFVVVPAAAAPRPAAAEQEALLPAAAAAVAVDREAGGGGGGGGGAQARRAETDVRVLLLRAQQDAAAQWRVVNQQQQQPQQTRRAYERAHLIRNYAESLRAFVVARALPYNAEAAQAMSAWRAALVGGRDTVLERLAEGDVGDVGDISSAQLSAAFDVVFS